MGIMSKGGGSLSERPLPPSAEERDEDLQSLCNNDDDAVFALGKKYFIDYYSGILSTPTGDANASTASLNSSTSSTSSDVAQAKVDRSYSDVTQLLSLYSDLKDAPSTLEDEYSRLKETSYGLTESISELRSISQNFSLSEESPKGKASVGSKSKTKARKKN